MPRIDRLKAAEGWLGLNRFELLGLSLLGFGSALSSASYWLLSNVPLTALGIGVAVLGASIP